MATKTKGPLRTECGNWGLAVVLASFVVHLLTINMLRCAGFYFLSYQNEFQTTTAETSAIFSIMSTVSYMGSIFGGVLVNHFGCRFTAILGGVLNTAGILGGSLTTNVYQMYFTSALAGIGAGIAFVPATVMVAKYFRVNFTLACGFTTCGVDIGMLILAPSVQLMLDTYGWRGTMLITGGLTANVCAAGAIFRPLRIPSKTSDKQNNLNTVSSMDVKMVENSLDDIMSTDGEDNKTAKESPGTRDKTHIKTVSSIIHKETTALQATPEIKSKPPLIRNPFTVAVKLLRLHLLCEFKRLGLYCCTQITVYLVAYNCYILYIVPFAATLGIPEQDASFLISVCGIGGIIGRILCVVLIKKISSQALYQGSMFIACGAVLLLQLGITSLVYVSATIVGCTLGIQYTIWRLIVFDLVGVDNLGSALGIYSFLALPLTIAVPILLGALYDATESYFSVFYIVAGFYSLAFMAMFLAPILKRVERSASTKKT